MSKRDCKLILALDLPDRESALKILDGLRGKLEWVKIGLQMYLKYGADFVREVSGMGFKIFLDLKLFDIPNTVASAVESVSALPVSMLTIHASGGREMMRRAAFPVGTKDSFVSFTVFVCPRYQMTRAAAITWPMTVAAAAPAMPQ